MIPHQQKPSVTNPTIEERVNSFIKKWCGENAAHLLDSDENDGQKLRSSLSSTYKQGYLKALEDAVGNIGAKLLARHSPQAILDAYFDAANEVLEETKEQHEINN